MTTSYVQPGTLLVGAELVRGAVSFLELHQVRSCMTLNNQVVNVVHPSKEME